MYIGLGILLALAVIDAIVFAISQRRRAKDNDRHPINSSAPLAGPSPVAGVPIQKHSA